MKNNKFKEFFRALKFTLISISAGIIQIGLFTLFNELCNWNYWAAYLTSLVASILWNFTINRKVTFKATNNVKIAMLLVFVFYLIFILFYLLTYFIKKKILTNKSYAHFKGLRLDKIEPENLHRQQIQKRRCKHRQERQNVPES